MFSIRSRVARLWWWAWPRLELRLGEHSEFGGFELIAVDHGLEDFAPMWFEKVRRALILIETTAPHVARRLRKDVDRIVIDGARGSGYIRSLRAIRLYAGTLQHFDTIRAAMTIVHEGTHARIAARGIPYAADQRGRQERLCVKAETRFAARVPGGAEIATGEMRKLQRRWWSDEAMAERRQNETERIRTILLDDLDKNRMQLPAVVARALRRRIARD